MPEGGKGEAREKAAVLFDVSPRYIQEAKKLQREHPELIGLEPTDPGSCEPGAYSSLLLRARINSIKKEQFGRKGGAA